jgi:hypothetical protein
MSFKFIRQLASKILFCNVLDLDNVMLHIPLGLVCMGIAFGFCLAGMPALGAGFIMAFTIGFVVYEVAERPVVRDKAFPDIQGYLAGLLITGIIILLVSLPTSVI